MHLRIRMHPCSDKSKVSIYSISIKNHNGRWYILLIVLHKELADS